MWGLVGLAFLLALVQRPGLASSDTKIDLHVDPIGFLRDVASAWSSTGDLGHVQGGQYGGYLFPMGPFFALGHALGLAPWLVQRLWLGLILALAAWGAVKLMDEFAGRPRGVAHAVTGLLFLLNPYVVVFSARTTVTLLGYAALPWLLICVRRGIRASPWWWAAAFALIVTASGGGVNAAVTAWMLVGPLLLALYERWVGATTWRRLWAFGWRTALTTGLVSAWWVMPLLVQSRFGVDFLRFTEQPGTIWSTTSLAGVAAADGLLDLLSRRRLRRRAAPVLRRRRRAAVLAPGRARRPAGPALEPDELRLDPPPPLRAVRAAARPRRPAGHDGRLPGGHAAPQGVELYVQPFLAGAVPADDVQGGPAGRRSASRCSRASAPPSSHGRALLVAVLILPLVASWPLIRGRGVDDQLLWERIPLAWEQAADHVDETVGDGRAVVLPGQLYAYYDWGGTIDPILPVLADKPVATRNAVGYSDLRATDLLWTVDALVQQRRTLPDQLDPLLDLLGARTVISGADDDRTRSGAAPAAEAAEALAQLGRPSAQWGAQQPRPRAAGTLGEPIVLPEVRAWDRPEAPGLVRIEPPEPQFALDGSAEGFASLSPVKEPLAGFDYAADMTSDAAAPREGGRDHRLQPPARARDLADGAERGPGAGGGRRRRRSTPPS